MFEIRFAFVLLPLMWPSETPLRGLVPLVVVVVVVYTFVYEGSGVLWSPFGVPVSIVVIMLYLGLLRPLLVLSNIW